MPEQAERLLRQLDFIVEIDKLKRILRRSYHLEGGRRENDAEHSWHLAVMVVLLQEYANEPVDVLRTIKMVLVHDLVEIDAGDTFCYDDAGAVTKAAREEAAADRIFALLPDDQAAEVRALWDEFEACVTPEARFAAVLDRLEPLLLNYHTEGRSWREHGIGTDKVIERNMPVARRGSQRLAEYIEWLIKDAAEKGYLAS